MIVATTEYWGLHASVIKKLFHADIQAPRAPSSGAQAWECVVSIAVSGEQRSVSHFGQDSMQALQHAVGFVVSEQRSFLLSHQGPLGCGPDDVTDDNGVFAREFAEGLRRFDPSATLSE